MKDIFLSFVLGIAVGLICCGMYYDGFVTDEYKQKIKIASDALIRAQNEINQKDSDLETLAYYIDSLIENNKKAQQRFNDSKF